MTAVLEFPLAVWLLVVAVSGVPPAVTRWDVADCNIKARDSVPAARPSENGAARALQPDPSSPGAPLGATGDSTMSPGETFSDVQGVAPHRANDDAYVLAYRLCMRQRGF